MIGIKFTTFNGAISSFIDDGACSVPFVENNEDHGDVVPRVSLADGFIGKILTASLRVTMPFHVFLDKLNNIFS